MALRHLCLALIAFSLLASTGRRVEAEPAEYTDAERNHWSFRPRRLVAPPTFGESEHRRWVRNPIDAFVLRRLLDAGLRPAPEALPGVLTRRVVVQLTGLPPTPEQLEQRGGQTERDAYERLVDRLLADPRYGEHWGQHWLDVVRFAESEGFEYDRHRPGAWRFRDYVIESFNAEKPYDQFVREQLAGDELTADTPPGDLNGESRRQWIDARVASGFHRLGPIRRNAGNPEVAFSRNEVLTEMTDIVGAAFLGVTLGCARCHDHMFDPIRQTDYYQLQAFMAATHEDNIVLADQKRKAVWQAEDDRIERKLKAVKSELAKAEGADETLLRKRIAELEAQKPTPLPTISAVRNDQKQRSVIHLLDRGLESLKKQPMSMQQLGVLLPPGARELPPDTPNPKTRLADWIASPDHPLTARVIVNRIWHYHFGRGLVATPNDFGANGDPPSHPELLDHLAEELIRNQWRLKPIHRLILTSQTYRQASRRDDEPSCRGADADNRLLWKFRRRRLEAQEIRDAMLAVSGQINNQMHGPSVMIPVAQELVDLLYKPTQWQLSQRTSDHVRRSVYLVAKRNLRLPFMEVFDQPDLQSTCSRRVSSTHAPQALELLNGRTSNELAEAFADRLIRECGSDPATVTKRAFVLATGRPPTRKQQELAEVFLGQHALREFTLAIFNLNAFLYVD